MPTYTITGADGVQMQVRAPSVPEAATHARARGVEIASIDSESGQQYEPEGDGWRKAGQAEQSDEGAPLLLLSVVLPIVGIILGVIWGARGKGAMGHRMIWAAIIGAIAQSLLLALLFAMLDA